MKNFTGNRWWEQSNPAFRKSCRNKAFEENIELKGQYDYFIKMSNNNKT